MFTHLFGRYNRGLRAEFLPTWVCYISVRIFCFWNMFFARSPLWFTATNPGFPMGGLYPTSKWDILQQLPEQRIPKTIFLKKSQLHIAHIYTEMKKKNMSFPLIIKPDNGLRGLGVKIFHTKENLEQSFATYALEEQKRGSWLLQEFINTPLEIGVFYIHDPKTETGNITGIVQKEFLTLKGDGNKTFAELVHEHSRARYHIDLLQQEFSTLRNTIIAAGKEHKIVEIGTHSRGSTFLDISDTITPELVELFTTISGHIEGFYYGRYDIRTASIESLLAGNFNIIEINPTYGEPTWMYDPSYNFFTQQKILLQHWSIMYTIAKNNHSKGVAYATYEEWKQAKKEYTQLGI